MRVHELLEQKQHEIDTLIDDVANLDKYQVATRKLMSLIETEAPQLWDEAQRIEDAEVFGMKPDQSRYTELEEVYILLEKHETLKAMNHLERLMRRARYE